MPLDELRALVAAEQRDEFNRLAAPIERDFRMAHTLAEALLSITRGYVLDEQGDGFLDPAGQLGVAVGGVDEIDLRRVDAGADEQAGQTAP